MSTLYTVDNADNGVNALSTEQLNDEQVMLHC